MIGETLKYLRVFSDLTMIELGEKLDLSQSFISEIENGKKQPTLQIIERYADYFSMKPSTILLFSEALDKDTDHSMAGAKQRVAYAGMKLIKIIEKAGKLENE